MESEGLSLIRLSIEGMNNYYRYVHDMPSGEGRISVSTHYYDNGHYVTICDHGATTSGATYITMDAGFKTATIHWGDKIYDYDNVDTFWALSIFASTLSIGKTANAIKTNGTLRATDPPLVSA